MKFLPKLQSYSHLLMLLLLNVVLANNAFAANKAILIDIKSAISPATVDYIERGMQYAVKQKSPLIIMTLNTPGGLDKSMRNIIELILNSSLPIVVYVAPSGAHAASAGTFILYASHVAAMAPGTNLGAASPVSITPSISPGTSPEKKNQPTNQETLTRKASNDAVAYIRSLAQMRNRNIEFAEKAVKNADTLTAQEALNQKVIEIVAADNRDLLKQLDGRNVTIQGKSVVLHTAALETELFAPDWRLKLLAVITDPSIAYILLLIGIYGLFFEFMNPGFVMPGVVGGISLLLALYAFQLLPINYVGLGLILLGIIFLVMEAVMPSFGILGIGGIIAFIVGSVLLFDPTLTGYQVAWPLILAMALVNAGFLFFVVSLAYKSRRKTIVSGREELIGMTGYVLDDVDKTYGQALIHGEIWKIRSTYSLKKDEVVRVIAINGLILSVEPECHSREGGNPGNSSTPLDSRLRGNDTPKQ